MTNSTDVSDVKMTRFGQRVDLFRERHVRVKNEAKIASRETDWDWVLLHTLKIFLTNIFYFIKFVQNYNKKKF